MAVGPDPGRSRKQAVSAEEDPKVPPGAGAGTEKKPGNKQETEENANAHEIRETALLLGHVSANQTAALLAFLLGVKAFLITPTFLTLELSTGAWISVIISVAAASLGTIGWLKWSRLTSGLSFFAALQKTLGKALGTLLCALITASFIVTISFSIRLFAGGAAIGLLPDVPVEILLIALIAASAYSAWAGLESLARASTFFFAPTVLSFLVIVVSSLRDLDLRNLLPFWGPGPAEVGIAGLRLVGLWGILPAFAALKTYVRREDDLAKGVVAGLLAGGTALTATVISVLLYFPYPSGTRLTHPMGILARSIYLGRYVQRIEAVFVFTWFFPSAIQAGFAYFVILVFFAQMSGVNTYRPFLPALAALTFAVGALPVSLHKTAQLLSTYFFNTTGTVLMSLGWVLYAVARLRGMKVSESQDTEAGSGQGANGDRAKRSRLSRRAGGAPDADEDGERPQGDKGGDSHASSRSPTST